MKRLLIIAFVLLMAVSASGETLSGLIPKFRARINETDTTRSFVSDTTIKIFLNQAQDKLNTMKGFIRKKTDIQYSTDSLDYDLPSDFNAVEYVLIAVDDSSNWEPVYHNPGLLADTNKFNYSIGWFAEDTAVLYVAGSGLFDEQVLRVHYLARASSMTVDTSTCLIPERQQVYIIEEAVNFYYQALREFQVATFLHSATRTDLGLMEQSK